VPLKRVWVEVAKEDLIVLVKIGIECAGIIAGNVLI
jgi:hypothetical protein